MVRAKFKCENVVSTISISGTTHGVTLRPVVGGSPENDNFYKWTPGGAIELNVVSDDTADQFTPGKEYYVDFTEV